MHAQDWAFVAVDWNGTVVPFFGRPAHRDALATLSRVRESGMPLFVVSRAPQAVIAADVARIGLAVDGVIGCLDKAPVLSDLRAQHGAGVLIGDTTADLRAAEAAGVDFLQARLEGEDALLGVVSFTDWVEIAPHLLAEDERQG